jgi:hypothetical protein
MWQLNAQKLVELDHFRSNPLKDVPRPEVYANRISFALLMLNSRCRSDGMTIWPCVREIDESTATPDLGIRPELESRSP